MNSLERSSNSSMIESSEVVSIVDIAVVGTDIVVVGTDIVVVGTDVVVVGTDVVVVGTDVVVVGTDVEVVGGVAPGQVAGFENTSL